MSLLSLEHDGFTPNTLTTCPGCLALNAFATSSTYYHCTKCNRRGDTVQYLRDFHCLSFKEACNQLGIELNKDPYTILWTQLQTRQNSQEEAMKFVTCCHKKLMNTPLAKIRLYDCGFTDVTMEQFSLGWHEKTTPWLPKGFVYPTFDTNTNQLIKIRIQLHDKLGNFMSISGKSKTPSIYGYISEKPVVIFKNESQAILTVQNASDLCTAVALGECTYPTPALDKILRASPLLLFTGHKTDYDWWKMRYPNMIHRKIPKLETGLGRAATLRKWLLEGIQQNRR